MQPTHTLGLSELEYQVDYLLCFKMFKIGKSCVTSEISELSSGAHSSLLEKNFQVVQKIKKIIAQLKEETP